MNSDETKSVSKDLTILRLARGLLMIDLGLIYWGLIYMWYAHINYINYPLAVYDPLPVALVTPLFFTSFMTGIFTMSFATKYMQGITGSLAIANLFLIVSVGLEMILLVLLWWLGVLFVQGYGLFLAIAVFQFILLLILVFLEVSVIYRAR